MFLRLCVHCLFFKAPLFCRGEKQMIFLYSLASFSSFLFLFLCTISYFLLCLDLPTQAKKIASVEPPPIPLFILSARTHAQKKTKKYFTDYLSSTRHILRASACRFPDRTFQCHIKIHETTFFWLNRNCENVFSRAQLYSFRLKNFACISFF